MCGNAAIAKASLPMPPNTFDFGALRAAFIRPAEGSPRMGLRANYALPLPPLTGAPTVTLRTACGQAFTMDRPRLAALVTDFGGTLPAPFVRHNGKGRRYIGFAAPPSAEHLKGKTVMLARVLTGAKPGEKVRYLDGDPFNLCMENLEVIRPAKPTSTDRREAP